MDVLKRIGFKTLNFKDFCSMLEDETESLGEGKHTVADLKLLSTRHRGFIFELFCREYLLNVAKYDEAYLLNDLPDAVRTELRLSKQDLGIDIIARCRGDWVAVQCKFRTCRRDNPVSWRDLSTFLSLCQRSGPYARHIVMTSAPSVRRVGGKQEKDLSICRQTFEKMDRTQWLLLLGDSGDKLPGSVASSAEEMRQKRLLKFN